MKLLRTFSGGGLLVACLALAMGLIFVGCRSADVPVFSSDVPGGAPSNRHGTFDPGDLVTVTFSGVTEPPPPHEERITDDGTITLTLIGAVRAAGKNAGELQKEIRDRYQVARDKLAMFT